MPTYEHRCNACAHEWEDMYSIKQEPPTLCPKCAVEGKVQRLISGGAGKGIVELSGQELKDKIKSEANDIKKEMYSSEKAYSNMLGEDRYQGLQVRMDRAKRDRPRIKTGR